jgi:cytochrome P450/NADPH-cytochrome P450 reductase
MANSYELQNELSDEKRFKKVVAGPLKEVRRAAGDGLFTSVIIFAKYATRD